MVKGFYPINLKDFFSALRHLNRHFRILFSRSQSVQRNTRTTVPTTDTLDIGESAWYDDGTNRRLYINLGGTIRYVDLT